MKIKHLTLLLALTAILALFAACSSTEAEVTLDITALGTDLSKVQFVDPDMALIDSAIVTSRYGFTSSSVKVVAYGGSGATPEEIIVAEYESSAKAKEAFDGFKSHLDSQKSTFDDYNAEYRPLLDTPILEQIGKYVVYCVCDAPTQAQAVVDSYK